MDEETLKRRNDAMADAIATLNEEAKGRWLVRQARADKAKAKLEEERWDRGVQIILGLLFIVALVLPLGMFIWFGI